MRRIDADELKKEFCKDIMGGLNWERIIDNAPTIGENWKFYFDHGYRQAERDLKRPQGEWIIVKDERYGDNVKCPFCGKELAGTDLNFCCKCGAKNGIKAAGIKDISQANEMADRLDQLANTKVFYLSFETKEALRYAIATLRRGGTA